jgi:peptidyl-tRNA hydrolase, PTH2 family
MSNFQDKIYSDESVKARAEQEDPIILYFIVRKELNMSTGKTAAQVGHAAQMAILDYFKLKNGLNQGYGPYEYNRIDLFESWLNNSFRKVVLGADDKRWQKLKNHFQSSDIWIVRDAGLTEVEPQSETVMAVFPMKKSNAPQVIKKLQALK